MRGRTIEQYLRELDATPEEREATLLWAGEGNDIENNPFFMCKENGSTMDFLSALRTAHEQKDEQL